MGRAGGVVACGLLLGAATSLAACRYDRGDFYEASALSPYEAALRIYGDDEMCVTCVEEECAGDAQACAEDPACAEDAACRVDCERGDGNPDCQVTCADRHPVGERPTRALEEECLIVRCAEACRVGRDFDCVGKYSPRLPQTDTPIVHSIQLTNINIDPVPAAGIRARVCLWPDLDCAFQAGADAFSDETGKLEVAFPAATRASLQLQPFQGYIEIDDPASDPPRTRPTLYVPTHDLVPEALAVGNTHPWSVFLGGDDLVGWLEGALGVVTMSDRGYLVPVLRDCRWSVSARGAGATFEVTPSDGETRIFYDYSRSAEATGITGVGHVTNLPPDIVTLRAFRSGMEIARTDVPVRAGANTFVLLRLTPAL